MSKLLLFTDNHFCETSSIVRAIGKKYSVRLENQIESLNWVESLAKERDCAAVICLGDFFDKPSLSDNELTALRDIKWDTTIPHYFIVGNHESEEAALCFNSTKALESSTRRIISEPTAIAFDNTVIEFLPYIVERNRKPIAEYFGQSNEQSKHKIILSHNDLKGLQLGLVETKTGFEIPDIEANCDLFINGHLHNGGKITKKVINLGNLTGQDFKEDAAKYRHNVMILDTDTLKFELIENPVALNFYSLEINNEQDLVALTNLAVDHAVISVKCLASLLLQATDIIQANHNIVASRILTIKPALTTTSIEAELIQITDYMAELDKFCRGKIDNSAILDYELAELCK